ncbi:nitrate/sulfonate/bicarbonate ABC transporter substrate-binding protein [Paenibacillus mucilaginosus 3016]|uniref:Nitrate/sulfonate/bicarbonate ABC transporter substrate-binding protein n=2 Tax=Paenibacillus mucilaginosus TaxID=61624 RepID=H6NRJ7_9BACL|nr:ABC transporter substrate-binding protein [Paenibacillus mucilaginosus]AFC27279.1 nitrate/sulfonate/bicarbonate ABC transporter substrate-binding protein [Paenibacillus mucilaginosus 3016]AFH59420.1 nitrate ABC transporter substrate-binding protein [Paenibacillus mucilaginosus K02]WFA16193.1 ABC transporter substrate-binding protein [Paenibacillus mucilaginosus]
MKRKNGTGSILAAALVLLLSACGTGGPSGGSPAASEKAVTATGTAEGSGALETKDITLIGVRDAQISSQQIIADKLGYFKEAGLNVTSKLIESGPDIGPMVSGGSAPVSIQTNFMDIILKSNGIGVKIVAPLAQIAGTQAVVGAKDLDLKSAKDLEGKTIGIPNGADVKIAIDNMGKELGVDVSKIKFVNLAPSDAVVALQNGDIDAMACWEPFITKATQAGGKFLFSGTKSELPEKKGDVNWMSVHTTMQVTDAYLQKNPNTVKAVLGALKKATDYINTNRDEAIKILAPELHLTEGELKEIMNRNVYSMEAGDTYVNGSNGPAVGAYLKSVGNIKTVPEPASYHDLSLLQAVDASLVKSQFK